MENTQIIKGSLRTVILQLLLNNGKMYGYEITRAVAESSKGKTKITEAALYPTLHKLEAADLVTVEPKTVDGRTRKYYKLTRNGKKEAGTELETLKEAIASLQKILKYQLKR